MKRAVIFLAILLATALIGDRLLGLAGLPSVRPFAHPPNHYERQTNLEYAVDFRTNSQGLRYTEIPLAKPSGEKRFFVLGDSFTEGTGVEANETFTHHLENRFANTRFINGGLSGTGPMHYWRLLNFVGLKYEPDFVLICIYANDVSNTPETLTRENLIRGAFKEGTVEKTLYQLFPRTHTMVSAVLAAAASEPKGDFVARVAQKARSWNVPEERISAWRGSLRPERVEAANQGKINGALLSYPLLRPRYWTDALDIDRPKAERRFRSMLFALDEIHRLARVGVAFIPTRWSTTSPHMISATPWRNWPADPGSAAGANCRNA
jgi:hypothetical protein